VHRGLGQLWPQKAWAPRLMPAFLQALRVGVVRYGLASSA